MDLRDRSTLFREPDGARKGSIFVALGLLCFGIYGFFRVRYGYTSLLFLAMGSANLLAALPDFLPKERTTLAGLLRVLTVLYGIVVFSYVLLQF